MTAYSIIIPHYGIPDLLVRCLDSIPDRDDIQVIVVDDGTPGADGFPGQYKALKKKNVSFIVAPSHGGAGYARNIGLRQATGKWLLFADADDFFMPTAWDTFDGFKDSAWDLILFRPVAVMSDNTAQFSHRCDFVNSLLDSYADSGDMRRLCAAFKLPSCKMIRRSLVEEAAIRFEEVPYSNDVSFAAQLSLAAGTIKVCQDKVYCLTERPGSLAYRIGRKPGEAECRTMVEFRAHRLLGRRRDNWDRGVSNLLWIMFNSDMGAFDRCFKSAREYGFPIWAAMTRVMWNAGTMKERVRLFLHCLSLSLKQ